MGIMPTFFLDVVDGEQVIADEEGIEFPSVQVAMAEAAQGARDLVAHGIMRNEDVSGQSFVIRNERGETVATVSFRQTLARAIKGVSTLLGGS